MGDFESAVKALGLPMCPHCGEMRQIEPDGAWWYCGVCSKTFPAAPNEPDVRSLKSEGTSPKPVGIFKVLPR